MTHTHFLSSLTWGKWRRSDVIPGTVTVERESDDDCVAAYVEELEPELTRISLRSKSASVDVNQVAAQFGGGGHPAAAGARISGTPLSVQRKLIAAIKRAIKAAK